MKKYFNLILAAIRPLVLTMGQLVLTIVFCGTSVFTSCVNDDNPATPVEPDLNVAEKIMSRVH